MACFLVVDDDPVHRHLIRMILAELVPGAAPEEAESGPAALARLPELARERPGRLVVLVDQNMPAMSGLEFVRAARHRVGPAVEFVLWSTVLPDLSPQEQERLGLRAIVEKPMELAGFFDLLGRLAAPDGKEAAAAPDASSRFGAGA